jgi:pilus assembly protein CpaD
MNAQMPKQSVRAGRPAAALARRLACAGLLAAALLPAGCASYSKDHVVVGAVPDDYRTRHPVVVKQSENFEDVAVAASARSLSSRDKDLVAQFATRYRRSGVTGMAIMIPAGSRNEAAARRLAHEAVSVLHANRVPSGQIEVYSYQAAGGDAAPIRLTFGALTASVESQCGDWGEDVAETAENRNYRNFGCATQHNLAAMIANPQDLLGPRAETEIDSTRRTKVITDWRNFGTGDLPPLF